MDQSDSATLAEERVETEEASPPGRRRLLTVLAVFALAGTLISLASLRLADSSAPAGVDEKALTDTLPVELPALPAVPGVSGILPGLGGAAPAGQAPAAQAPAAPAPAAVSPAAAHTVTIMNFAYSPATLTIAAGDTVTWTNHDTAPHNVVVTDGPEEFTSPTLQTGQSFSFTFTRAGTYSYYCSLHPQMTATVTVTGGSEEPPPPPNDGSCVSKDVLDAFMAHVESAHLERGLFQQVTDILAIDQYVLTHTVWLESLLQPVYDGTGDQVVKDTLAPIMAHIESAHLQRSPLQQVTDILAIDQYVLTHTVWLQTVMAPLAEQLTC